MRRRLLSSCPFHTSHKNTVVVGTLVRDCEKHERTGCQLVHTGLGVADSLDKSHTKKNRQESPRHRHALFLNKKVYFIRNAFFINSV